MTNYLIDTVELLQLNEKQPEPKPTIYEQLAQLIGEQIEAEDDVQQLDAHYDLSQEEDHYIYLSVMADVRVTQTCRGDYYHPPEFEVHVVDILINEFTLEYGGITMELDYKLMREELKKWEF